MKPAGKNKYQKPPLQKPSKKKEKPAISITDKYLLKYGNWIAFGLITLLILIIFQDFLVGKMYYLFKDIGSDSLNLAYPQFVLVKEYLRSEGYPTWSFAQGMGQNVVFSLNDPFSWIVTFSGQGSTAYAFIWMELVKIALAAFFFYRFLRFWKLSQVSLIIGTILYTFSGFIIVGSGWNIFSAEACLLAMLLYSFEKVYKEGNWLLFPLVIALIAMLQPFDLYIYGLFLILYFLLRHFTEENPSWKKLFRVTLQLAGCSILGLVVSSFFLVSNIQVILDSPRVGGNSSYFQKLFGISPFSFEQSPHNTAAILRFFSNDILGNGSNFKGWYNYLEAPLFYIGLLPLLIFPQIFVFATRKRKIIYAIFLILILIPVIFPFFRYALWLFTGDYYRGFSIYVSLTFLLLSLFGLNEIEKGRKINLIVLGGTFVFLLILLFYPFKDIDQIMDKGVQTGVLNFLIFYFVLLALLWIESVRPYVKIIIILAVFTEMAYFNFHTVNDRVLLSSDELKSKTGYNDYSVDAVAYIKERDKQFFRINKGYTSDPAIHTSFNDAKVQGYFGTMSYFSFNQKYYIRFLEEMNIIKKGQEFESRWAQGLASHSLLLYMASTKYQLLNSKIPPSMMLENDSITQIGNVRILKIKHFLPLGFTYQHFVPLKTFSKLTNLRKDLTLQKAVITEEPVDQGIQKFLTPYTFSDTTGSYTYDDLFRDLSKLKEDTFAITSFHQKRIKGTITARTPELLFFSIPFDKGWHAQVDGKEEKPTLCNIGFMGFVLQPGHHDVTLYFKPLFFSESLIITIIGIILYLGLIIGYIFFLRKSVSIKKENLKKVNN